MNSSVCVPLEKYQHSAFEMQECELILTDLFGVNYLLKTKNRNAQSAVGASDANML